MRERPPVENWLPTKLDQVSDPSARRHLDAFARWHLLRQLRDRAKREPLPAGAFLNAKQSTTVAIDFLDWLSGYASYPSSADPQHRGPPSG